MTWGDDAAEQYEKDQPSEINPSCLRPDGVNPELPLKDRNDFDAKVRQALGRKRILRDLRIDCVSSAETRGSEAAQRNLSYADRQLARVDAELDQLVLMRAAQILDEAEHRRQYALSRFQAGARAMMQPNLLRETPAEIVLDDAERRGE